MVSRETDVQETTAYSVGDIIGVPHPMSKIKRVWRVVGIYFGGEDQESVIELEPLDYLAPTYGPILVPYHLLVYREKQAEKIASLASEVNKLEQENTKLFRENEKLRSENADLQKG